MTDVDLYNDLKKTREASAECQNCTFLPSCTSYRKLSCPVILEHCREYEEIRSAYSMMRRFDKVDSEDGDDPC